MKSKNYDKIINSYLKFAIMMICSIAAWMCIVSCFMWTFRYESSEIEKYSFVFDQTFNKQMDVVESADSLYNSISIIGNNPRINYKVAQQHVSKIKISFVSNIQNMNSSDVLLYNELLGNINKFLLVKDSIITVTQEEQKVKSELIRLIKTCEDTSNDVSVTETVTETENI